MKTKKPTKPYWEMTTAELREATKQFDEEFVGDKARPLTPDMKARWERAKAKGVSVENGSTADHMPATMNSIERLDVEGTKRKNIIEMALEFTAMIRIFAKESKKRIAEKLEEFFLSLGEIRNRDDYEVRHRSFCVWFTENISVHSGGSSSYGQAAKILDVAIKVYVYYCAQPTPEVSARIVPFLHGAIDTAILKYLKAKYPRGEIGATTIKKLDEEKYKALQSLLAKSQAESLRNLHAVQYDDLLWRWFARPQSHTTGEDY